MLFSDLNFIFRALPLFLIIYYLTPYKLRKAVLLLASLAFYLYSAGYFVIVLVGAVVINYALSAGVSRKKKVPFVISLVIDAGLLVIFKITSCLGLGIPFPDGSIFNLVLPLGISFYAFKLISYQADLYMGRTKKASFINLAVYITDFTQIVSGPIGRYGDSIVCTNRIVSSSEKALTRIKGALSNISNGLTYFIAGLFLKIILADHLAILWNEIGTIGYDSISTPLAWIGVFVYSMNLYLDFWGYSLMAAGLGVMLGGVFVRNFKNPYAAKSVSDFYRRWHITLGDWFRDYIYIPLGGSRCGSLRTIFSLSVVWFLTGLWHGVTVNYLIWAGILLILIICEKFILSRNETLYSIVGRINVWVIIPLTWIVFAIRSFGDLEVYFMRLFGLVPSSAVINASDYSGILSEGWVYIAASAVILLPGIRTSFIEHRRGKVWSVLLFIMFWLSIYSICGAVTNPFMYMSF
ncbi:MAG: MBOAT family protein [Lachnospiraceae bacterium]|nr:MBOAT family protein [Lachnospiraceae bacterium]